MFIAGHYASPPDASDSTSGGENYLASTADLMIGLLFIFIILVVILSLEQRRQQESFQNQQTEIRAQRAALVGAGDPLIVVTSAIGKALKQVLPTIRIDPKTGVISLPEDALFARGSAQLSESGRTMLARAARELAAAMPCFVENERADRSCPNNPYDHEIETVFIEGHTDSVPFVAGNRDNFDLSLARARAVDQAMVQNTPLVDFKNKAGQQVFSFSAYADTRPLPGTNPADGVNRRVDLRIVLSYKPIEELIPALQLPAR